MRSYTKKSGQKQLKHSQHVLLLCHLCRILRLLHLQPAPRTHKMDGLSKSHRASTTAANTPVPSRGKSNLVMRVVITMGCERGEPAAVVGQHCIKQAACCSPETKQHSSSKGTLQFLCAGCSCALHPAACRHSRLAAHQCTGGHPRTRSSMCHGLYVVLHQNGILTNMI